MLLSEAIKTGSTFRSESHSGPFVRVANSDDLLSDVWGAACEAVHSLIAKRRWDKADKLAYDSDIEALRELQEKYFSQYLKMGAVCPGAKPRTIQRGAGRYTGRIVGGLNEFAVERESHEIVAGLTSACSRIACVAELIEHLFYHHGWTREECAEACEWFENKSEPLMIKNFEHYDSPTSTARTAKRLTDAAIARQHQRMQRKSYFLS